VIPILGMTAEPSDTALTLATFGPAIGYMRDFGQQQGAYLTPAGTGKSALSGAEDILFHYSWKGDIEQLAGWMDEQVRPYLLTRRHEPMGDIAPADYRAECARMVEIIAAHPKAYLCLAHGPITTRYWLDHGGDPADWWYEGAGFYGVDPYNGTDARYRTSEEMFGLAVRAARERGVPWLVGELGIERISSDPTGAGRAAAMRDHVAYAVESGDCLALAWWNKGGTRITGMEPEQSTWIELLEGGGMRQLWLADALRAAGLTVHEVDGWRTRSAAEDSDASTYEPRGVIIHETRGSATSTDAGEIGVLVNGREGLSGPIAQLYLGRDGDWHVVASGLCHHVKTGWGGPFAGVGNSKLLGIEPAHGESESWADKPTQYASYVRGVAAILRHTGWPVTAVVGHKEHQPGDKPDPEFSMGQFRTDVAAALAGEETEVDINMGQKLPAPTGVDNGTIGGALVTLLNRTDYLTNKLGLATRLDEILAAAVDDSNTTVTMSEEDRQGLAQTLAAAIAAPTLEDVRGVVDEELDKSFRGAADAA
jgi:N-acetylmuramoyl-L-alanine amidase-like protein